MNGRAGAAVARPSLRLPWRRLGILAVLGMELALLAPWLALIAGLSPAAELLLWLWLLALAWAGRSLGVAVDRLRLRNEVALLLSAGLLLLAILLTLNGLYAPDHLLDLGRGLSQLLRAIPQVYPLAPELPLALLIILLWRRGLAASAITVLAPVRTAFKFRVGVLLMAGLVVVRGSGAGLPATLLLFFFCSLLAMSIARADHLSRLRGAGEPPFSTQWLLSLLGLFALTMGIGFALGRGMNSSLAFAALGGLRRVLLGAMGLVYAALLPLLLALEPLFNLLTAGFRDLFTGVDADQPPQPAPPVPAGSQLEGLEPPPLFEVINAWLQSLGQYWPAIRTVMVLVVVALLALSAVRLVTRLRARPWRRDRWQDAGESLLGESGGPGPGGLRRMLDSVRSWGRALAAGQLRTAILVRRIYARLLALAEANGRGRHQWETPLEFQAALIRLFPDVAQDIRTITSLYQDVRYGLLPETPAAAAEVELAWGRVRDWVEHG